MIEPRILKGTRDFGPEDMAKRLFMLEKIRSVFERFGYDTIETPVIEYAETLLGKYGEEGSKLVYQFEDHGGRSIALRYDQTVPFARYVAMNYSQLPMPFKRYQISRVWRADKPAKGRYREFYQCDIDIIGTDTPLADAEVAAVIHDVYNELGMPEVVIRVNSRKLMNAILSDVGVSEEHQPRVMQLIDKLDKVDAQTIQTEVAEVAGEEQAEKLFALLMLEGTAEEKLAALEKYDTSEMENMLALAYKFGVPQEQLQFDLTLARGLDYYTGIIYEVVHPELDLGSICGGGRYANLTGMFTKQEFSGVGVAFGFDRTLVAMEELGLLDDVKLNAQVLVTQFDENSTEYSITIMRELQKQGINAELYMEPAKLGKQFKYADRKLIPFVVVAGPDEQKESKATVRDMVSGEQTLAKISEISRIVN